MLKPSLNDIVDKIENRYYLIATVSKRARDLVNGDVARKNVKDKDKDRDRDRDREKVEYEKPLIQVDSVDKPVVIASEEIIQGKIGYRLLTEDEVEAKELAHKIEQERKLLEQE